MIAAVILEIDMSWDIIFGGESLTCNTGLLLLLVDGIVTVLIMGGCIEVLVGLVNGLLLFSLLESIDRVGEAIFGICKVIGFGTTGVFFGLGIVGVPRGVGISERLGVLLLDNSSFTEVS